MTGRTTSILLAISLAFNVFIVGAAVGGIYAWRHFGGGGREAGGLLVAARQLGPDQRKAFRQVLVAARRDARADAAAAVASRDELRRLLAQPTLDRAAIDAALAATRAADMKVRAHVEGAVVDFAAGLDAQDRAKLIEGLASRGQMLRRGGQK